MATTLAEAQQEGGRDARVLTVIDQDLRTRPFSAPFHTVAAGIDEYVLKERSFGAPVSVLRDAAPGRLLKKIPPHALIHLHGYNGAISLEELHQLGEDHQVVWTLHDMNPFTGGCHYSLGCASFASDCSGCPAVKPAFRAIISRQHQKKLEAIAALENLSLVAPSDWLASQVRRSSIFAQRSVAVIRNPFSYAFNREVENLASSRRFETEGAVTVGVVAADLSDPVKNVAEAVRAFQRAKNSHPRARLLLAGARGGEHQGESVELLGKLSARDLIGFYSRCDALIISSLAENAPLVIAEAASRGCVVFARDSGGMPELIEELGSGFTYNTPQGLEHLMEIFVPPGRPARDSLSRKAQAIFGPSAVAKQYDEVYAK